MSVYNRKMFVNAPERLKVNSRGTGITSGLVPVKPIKMFAGGDPTFESLYEIYSKALGDQPRGFFAQNAPALLQFFSNLAEQAEGGKPLTGGESGPLLSTLSAFAKAAPPLANIVPYQDPAKALAAEKFAEFEIDKALTAAKAGPAEPKNMSSETTTLPAGTKIPLYGTDQEIIIGTTPGYPEGKYSIAAYTLGQESKRELIGGVDDDFNISSPNKVFYKKGDVIPVFGSDQDFTVQEGGFFNVVTGTKNGEEYIGLIGRADDPNEIKNLTTKIDNGQIIATYSQNNKIQVKDLGRASDDYKNITTQKVLENGEVVVKNWYRKNGILHETTLGVGEPTTQMIAEEKLDKAKNTIQEAWKAFQEKQNIKLGELSDTQLDRIYATVGDKNWTAITDEGKLVNLIDGVFFNQILPEFRIESEAKDSNKGTATVNGETTAIPDGTDANIIAYYNLNPSDPNFKNQYDDAVKKYADLPRPSKEVTDKILSGVDNIKTLAAMLKVADATTPLGEVSLYQSIAKTFNVAPFTDADDFVEFITLKELLDLQATDLLIKGVPSNIDLRKVENLTPSGSDSEQTVLKKLSILNGFFSNAILERIAYSAGKGEIIPENTLNEMREIFGNQVVNEALGQKWSPERVNDLNTMTREEYIKKYGDPFEKAKSFLDQDIDSYVLGSNLIDTEGSENYTDKDYVDFLMNSMGG